jgi:hypothetical protein
VSVEAISWALNLAPVPADRGGQPSSACKFVLVGLANHAGPDGTGAFPSVATLVRYTGLSERTVRTCLDRLEAEGIIQACDPDIIAARIKRADRRPKGWDLDLSLIRADLTDTEVAVLGRQFPGLGARAAAAACPDTREAPDGGQSPHPASAVDNPADRVQLLHPASGTGCNQRTDQVQPVQSRGATAAPEPSKEPYLEPPAAAAGACEASLASGAAGGGPAGEFFAALGDGWRLTPHPAAQARPSRHRGPGARLGAACARGVRRSEYQRRAKPLRSPDRPALARRTATAAATGASALVRPVRPDHPDARLPQRRAAPVPTLQTGMHTAGQARPQTAPTASIALTRAGQHRYPRGRGSRIPARAPGRRPGATAGQAPVPSPAVTITGGERTPRQRGTSLLPAEYGWHLTRVAASRRRAPIAQFWRASPAASCRRPPALSTAWSWPVSGYGQQVLARRGS